MRHHTPYPAMEVKRSENIRLVGIEAELADVRAKMAGYLKELGVDV